MGQEHIPIEVANLAAFLFYRYKYLPITVLDKEHDLISRNFSTFTLKAMSEETTYPVFETDDSTLIATDELIVKFKPETTQEEMDTLNSKYAVRVKEKIEWEPNAYILTTQVGSQSNALETSNRYIDSGKTVFAHPNFIRLFAPSKISDDTLSDQQWALNNTGQTGGIVDQDIRVLEAWEITKGHKDITIAILDEGVDYQHPDFQCTNKLVTGFDAVTGSDDPAPQNNDAHGTACAGIAAGCINNQTGISGVAPGCIIMGIRIALSIGDRWETNDQQIASGIHTAFVRGADILSNSWGGGTPSDLITSSIRRAKLEGRNGKGCVVCFAAGNDNSRVSYPTQYFFPEAYANGQRLEKDADIIYRQFMDLRKQHGVTSKLEIPMEYFTYAVENALKIYGAHGDKFEWITSQQWLQAIKITGYIESEIYMALALKEGTE